MIADNFRNHTVFEKISQIESQLSDQESNKIIDLDNLTFFKSCVKYIIDRLKTTIPILVQEVEMNALNNELDAGLQQINTYLGSSNSGYLTNATNNFNSALTRIRNFPIPFAKGDFDFSKVIANFEQVVKEKYLFLETEKNELTKQIENQSQDLIKQDGQIKQLYKLVEAKELEIQNLNTQFQAEFTALKTKASQEIESDRTTFRKEIDTDKSAFATQIDDLKSQIDTDTTDLVNNLQTKLEEAKKIVNVIGDVGVTGNYQRIANEHKSTANLWRGITIAFMTAFTILLVWTIFDLSSQGFDWIKSLIRILAAAALSYPATYAARESSRHRKLETINRTAELELAALSPFIELMPPEKQQIIKEKLVDKYFGNGNSETITKYPEEEGLSLGGLDKLVKALLPLLKK